MSARLSRTEAEIDALQELAGPADWTEDSDLEEQFRTLETNRSLKRLKLRAGDLSDLRERLDDE
jgi:hypothetical protein